jgi:ribose 5-phosphate isomerase B
MEKEKTIVIASDHAGYDYKEELKGFIESLGYSVKDFGTTSKESTDYPDYAYNAAKSIADGEAQYGFFVCGSGTGVTMTANKVDGIRAANCFTEEMAELARGHNNAHVLCMGQNVVSLETAKAMTEKFLATEFEGGRHARRVNKISDLTGK